MIGRLCAQVEAGNIAVACVYCDFYAPNEQSATGLLGALLKQVVSALEPIPDEVKKAFENSKGGVGGRRPLLLEVLEMLIKSLSLLHRVFICIDALDEFHAKHRPELWEALQLVVQKCPNIRLFLTGMLENSDFRLLTTYILSFLHKAKHIYAIVNTMVASTAFHHC